MRKKGFTLVELLAVIIILGILATITVISVNSIISNSKDNLLKAQKTNIEKAAKVYYLKEGIESNNYCVNVSEIIDKGYIDSNEVINPKTKKTMDGSVKITYEANQYSYNYSESSCKKLCQKVNESDESKKIGTQYKCDLSTPEEDTTFYVLEVSGDNVSLIMDRNFIDGDGTNGTIPETMAWCTDGESNNTTCKNINTTGTDAPTGKDYIGHITEVFNTSGVTVSFPSASQIAKAAGNNTENYYTDDIPTWLYDYLYETTNPNPNVYGYWTSSPFTDYTEYAWYVPYYGFVLDDSVGISGSCGVRPVITISSNDLN